MKLPRCLNKVAGNRTIDYLIFAVLCLHSKCELQFHSSFIGFKHFTTTNTFAWNFYGTRLLSNAFQSSFFSGFLLLSLHAMLYRYFSMIPSAFLLPRELCPSISLISNIFFNRPISTGVVLFMSFAFSMFSFSPANISFHFQHL